MTRSRRGDECDSRDSSTSTDPKNKNIGDLLNAKDVSWGWFQGGFADCAATHADVGGVVSKDYIPHHEPFQYYASTAKPAAHAAGVGRAEIGHDGAANHQYDLTDFWAAVDAGTMPAVSFLKAAAYQDGHAGYSTPLDEQRFLVDTINRLQRTPEWKNTAVVIAYDDSDGWYDHQIGPIVNQSNDPAHDALTADRHLRQRTRPGSPVATRTAVATAPGSRCWSSRPTRSATSSTTAVTDQTSILRFVEDNWNTGRIGNDSFDEKAGSGQPVRLPPQEQVALPGSGLRPARAALTLDSSAESGVDATSARRSAASNGSSRSRPA